MAQRLSSNNKTSVIRSLEVGEHDGVSSVIKNGLK